MGFIWDMSEICGVGLGIFAPFVFEKMMGYGGKKINKEET